LHHQQESHVALVQESQVDGDLTKWFGRIGLNLQDLKELADREHSLFDRQPSDGNPAFELPLDGGHELGLADRAPAHQVGSQPHVFCSINGFLANLE
jgi:hypothetical protein